MAAETNGTHPAPTGRVRLRPGRPCDAERLHAISAEPSVARWWGEPEPVTVGESGAVDATGQLP